MISNQLARLYYVVCRLILGLYSTSAHVCTCVVCVCFDTGYLIYHYHNLCVDVSGKHVCVCNCSYSHCTIIAANRSKGPFHRVKAVSVVECWTVCMCSCWGELCEPDIADAAAAAPPLSSTDCC